MSILNIEVARAYKSFLVPSRYKAIYGGRGGAKSHFLAGAGVTMAVRRQGLKWLCVREVQKSLSQSVKPLIEDKIVKFGVQDQFRVLNDRIITPGNGVISFVGMQDHNAESVKSFEGYDIAWVEESQTFSKRSLELLRPTIRKEGSEIWCSWNPRNATDPVDQFFRGEMPPENAIIQKINYDENPWFPAELEEERLHDMRTKPERYAHIWLGEYEPQAVGAIWTRQVIMEGRRHEAPTLNRIVVAVDPAVSNEQGSDEHGIVVCALGEDGRGYVLGDKTRRGSPKDWASRAIAAYDEHDADAIVIEVNQGGDMCRHTLQSVRPGIKIVEVRASRGKHVRAEPISALYEQGRISHVGTFPELEGQMCSMTAGGYEGSGSPDRLDALVWGMTELFPKLHKKKKKHQPLEYQDSGAQLPWSA